MAENHPPVLALQSSPKETVYIEIGKYFKSKFGSSPCFYVRVPGRVNLIGEHIDYCGFSVLPMAVEQEIVLAIGYNDSEAIKLINFDFDKYEDFSTPVCDIQISTSHPRWYHYFLCGYKGIAENYELKHKGLDVVVKGTIPPCAGLSSSSALVCSSALGTSFANRWLRTGYIGCLGQFAFKNSVKQVTSCDRTDKFPRISLSKMEIAILCAHSERYIGTEGGGMDQAIGFLAEPGTAKLIDFNPLKASNVPLPKGVAFVVCNSCVQMNKAASSQFNIRVIECRLAAKVLAKVHGYEWQNIQKLSEIPVLLGKNPEDMCAIVESCLPQKVYTKAEICAILEISATEFATLLSKNTQDLEKFQMNQRARHVYQEAARVRQFKWVCENKQEDALKDLGSLMNQSHESCRDLYECSHPDLDLLVSIALEAGALGSRLTGAGWGGCCVSLVMENKVQEFMSMVRKRYYENKLKIYNDAQVESAMFLTRPSGGAAVYSCNI